MATLTSTGLREPRTIKAIARYAGDVIHGIREGREMEHRYFVLSRLSERELARRGIRREDIPRVAVTGRAIF